MNEQNNLTPSNNQNLNPDNNSVMSNPNGVNPVASGFQEGGQEINPVENIINIDNSVTNQSMGQTPNVMMNGNQNMNPNPTNVNYPNNIPNQMPNNNNTIPPVNNPKKSNGLVKALVIVIALVVLGGGGFFAYKYFFAKSTPTKTIKDAINDVYNDFSSSLDKLEDKKINLSILEDSFKLEGDLELTGSTFADLKNDKLNFNLGLDYKNEKLELSGKLLENNKNLVDGTMYVTNNHYYLKSDSLLNNLYDLGEYDFKENFDLSELEDALNGVDIPSIEDIKFIVKELKDALLNSLNDDDFTQEKVELTINGNKYDVNKITYKINQANMMKLGTSLSKQLLNNDNLLNKLVQISGLNKDDIKSALEEMQETDFYEDIENEIEFNIYTAGLTNSFVGAELTNESAMVAYYNYKDNAYVNVQSKDDDWQVEVVSKKEKDVYNVTVNYNSDNKKEEIAKLTVRSFTEEEIDLDYEINYDDVDLKGTLKITFNKVSDKEVNGNINFSISGKDEDGNNQDAGIKLSYKITTGEKIADIKTSNALSSSDLTEEELTKIQNKIEELKDTSIYKYIESFLPDEEDYGTGTDIYDDDECWDKYMDSDYSSSYSDYYEEYC